MWTQNLEFFFEYEILWNKLMKTHHSFRYCSFVYKVYSRRCHMWRCILKYYFVYITKTSARSTDVHCNVCIHVFLLFLPHFHSICIYGCSECKYKVYWIYIFNWWLSGLTEQFLSTIRPLIDKSDVWVAYRPNTSVPILHVYPIVSSPGSIVSSLTKDIYCNK